MGTSLNGLTFTFFYLFIFPSTISIEYAHCAPKPRAILLTIHVPYVCLQYA